MPATTTYPAFSASCGQHQSVTGATRPVTPEQPVTRGTPLTPCPPQPLPSGLRQHWRACAE